MSIKQKICSHTPSQQVHTAHGLFCLDCGQLKEKYPKNKQVVQQLPPTTESQVITKSSSPQKSLIIKRKLQKPIASNTIKIGMADIRPTKRS